MMTSGSLYRVMVAHWPGMAEMWVRFPLSHFRHTHDNIVRAIIWNPNKVINIRELSVCEGGRLERFYFTIYVMHTTYTIQTIHRIYIEYIQYL